MLSLGRSLGLDRRVSGLVKRIKELLGYVVQEDGSLFLFENNDNLTAE